MRRKEDKEKEKERESERETVAGTRTESRECRFCWRRRGQGEEGRRAATRLVPLHWSRWPVDLVSREAGISLDRCAARTLALLFILLRRPGLVPNNIVAARVASPFFTRSSVPDTPGHEPPKYIYKYIYIYTRARHPAYVHTCVFPSLSRPRPRFRGMYVSRGGVLVRRPAARGAASCRRKEKEIKRERETWLAHTGRTKLSY